MLIGGDLLQNSGCNGKFLYKRHNYLIKGIEIFIKFMKGIFQRSFS